METLAREFRLALRSLWREPGHALVAVATIALGIGANVALFSVVHGSLLRPLPHAEPEGLLYVSESKPERGWRLFGVSAPAFEDWGREARSLSGLAAFAQSSANLATDAAPRRVTVVRATHQLLAVMGAAPERGRDLAASDQRRGEDAVVLLGHALWLSDFGGRADAVGATVLVDGRAHEIVGVMPEGIGFPLEDAQILRPLPLEGDTNRGAHWLQVLARVATGSSADAARAELAAIGERHAEAYPRTNEGWIVEAPALHEVLVGDSRTTLLLLFGAVTLVLLIACANVAHLLLVRAVGRQRAAAIRVALGASRGRLAREQLLESLALCAAGGLGALLVARGAQGLLVWAVGSQLPAPPTEALDPRVLAFAAGATLLATLVVGALPALHATRGLAGDALRGTGHASASPGSRRSSRLLVVGEMAVATVLLVGAILLLRSVANLLATDPGFDARAGLAFRVAPPQTPPQPDQTEEQFIEQFVAERRLVAGYYDALRERLEALPGVEATGAVNRLPLAGNWWTLEAWDAGRAAPPDGGVPVSGRVVTPGYFEAAGIAMRGGRAFDGRDASGAPPVAVVNETFARQVLDDAALGRQIYLDGPHGLMTVVGVVADVRLSALDEAARPTVYVPLGQAMFGMYPEWGMDVILRTSVAPRSVVAGVRREVAAAEGGLPVFDVATLDELVSRSTGERRAVLTLLGSFAGLAVLLAGIGLFGVVSHSVRQRTRELGIRLALGARSRGLRVLVLREAGLLGAVGAALGLAAALGAGRMLEGLLYGVTAGDPVTYVGSAAVLGAVVLLAAWRPAALAGRTDPLVALRQD